MENENEINPQEIKIRKLENALYLIASVHCGDGHDDDETCIYCGTKWPCFTARVARKSATNF